MAAVTAALFSIVASLSTARASIVANDAAGLATSSKEYHACKPLFSLVRLMRLVPLPHYRVNLIA